VLHRSAMGVQDLHLYWDSHMKSNSLFCHLPLGMDPIALMVTYAGSVAVVLIAVTLLALKVYRHIEDRIMRYSKYLPEITAGLLDAMAIAFATGSMTR
jgi:nitrate reductase gamma subunit